MRASYMGSSRILSIYSNQVSLTLPIIGIQFFYSLISISLDSKLASTKSVPSGIFKAQQCLTVAIISI